MNKFDRFYGHSWIIIINIDAKLSCKDNKSDNFKIMKKKINKNFSYETKFKLYTHKCR